jgi:hypothetical protein
LARPSSLETAWYDNDGRLLWRGAYRLPLPVVQDDPYLLCDASECLTSRPFADLSHLPPPDPTGNWRPLEPGHYVVRARLHGDQQLDCRIDLDVVESAAEAHRRAGDDLFRWAECVAWSPNPVNNPGAVPYAIGSPSITFIADTATVDIAVTPRNDDELRGWFILAPPGVAEPWNEAVYQSPIQQKLLTSGEPASFEWSVHAGAEVEPGVYRLTVWFHRRGAEGWEHAAGGDLELAPVVVADDHTLRWAGPVRGRLARPVPAIPAGLPVRPQLSISGTSSQIGCAATWRLYAEREVVAAGQAADCEEPEIAIPGSIPPGRYRLQVDLFAGRNGELRLSDAVSTPVTITERAGSGAPS